MLDDTISCMWQTPSIAKGLKIPHHPIDEIDSAILLLLQRSARATNSHIGQAVGLSPSAVSRRIQALEDQGIIVGYQAIVDESVMGRGITVFIRVTLEKQSATALNSFENAIRRWNGAVFCYLMAGQYDYMLQIKVADIADYERLHRKELSTLPGVARLESSFSVRDVSGLGAPARASRNSGRQSVGRTR